MLMLRVEEPAEDADIDLSRGGMDTASLLGFSPFVVG